MKVAKIFLLLIMIAVTISAIAMRNDSVRKIKKEEERSTAEQQMHSARMSMISGLISMETGNLEKAKKDIQSSMAVFSNVVGEKSEEVGICYGKLAIVALRDGNRESADNLQRKAMEVLKSDQSYKSALEKASEEYKREMSEKK